MPVTQVPPPPPPPPPIPNGWTSLQHNRGLGQRSFQPAASASNLNGTKGAHQKDVSSVAQRKINPPEPKNTVTSPPPDSSSLEGVIWDEEKNNGFVKVRVKYLGALLDWKKVNSQSGPPSVPPREPAPGAYPKGRVIDPPPSPVASTLAPVAPAEEKKCFEQLKSAILSFFHRLLDIITCKNRK